jgi:hypothetical protein
MTPPVNNNRNIPIEINLKSMLRAYESMMYVMPLRAFDACVNAAERLSTRSWMRTGGTAALTLPLSIALRHAAQGANLFNKGLCAAVCNIGSMIGGLGGWFVAGKAAAGMLAMTSALSGIPALATFALAGVMTLPVLVPALALSTVAIKMFGFTAGFATGHLPAGMNIGIGLGRTIDYLRGQKKLTYGENFSDGAPFFAAPPEEAPVAPAFKEPKPTAPDFNGAAATTLDSDITYKKIKLKVKAPVVG